MAGTRDLLGEGNGTPLQYFCLENPMDGGAWWAAVHWIAEGRTWLSDFTFTFHFHALEKEMAAHSSVLAWRIPGMAEHGGLPSMGLQRVGHNWSDLAAETYWAASTALCLGDPLHQFSFLNQYFFFLPDQPPIFQQDPHLECVGEDRARHLWISGMNGLDLGWAAETKPRRATIGACDQPKGRDSSCLLWLQLELLGILF